MTNTPSPDEDRELIERLRKCADGLPSHGYDWFRGNMWEAADRIESLLSDRAKLEEEIAPLRKLRDDPSWEIIRNALNRSTDR